MNTNTLSSGREFEKEFFGLTASWIPLSATLELDFDAGVQTVIQGNWARFTEACEAGASYAHNPTKPEMGKTPYLWLAVRKRLPKQIDGRSSPLNLYIALGSSLDLHYGIDAFFWWEDVYVTLDLSLRKKRKGAEDPKMLLKADFLLGPICMTERGLNRIGLNIAGLLRRRRDGLVGRGQRISKARFV